MNAAENLFQFLQGLKFDDDPGKSPQERLFEYCTQPLGFIERFHVEFKEKSDRRDAKLSDDDKKNLAKAISGFANSGGGVLIWGIENSTIAPKPITDIQKFVAALLSLAPQTTEPVVPGIDGDWMPADTGNLNEGFGIIYVPESSLPPHRVLLKYDGIKDHYFVRSGEAFVIASHIQLEDMFGRRPHPELKFIAKLGERGAAAIIVGVKNVGRGIAKFPFLAIEVEHSYVISEYGLDGNGHLGLPILVQDTRTSYRESFGGSASIVVYPDSELNVTVIRFDRQYSINPNDPVPDLVISFSICCEGMQMLKGEERIQGDLIKDRWLRKQ